MCIYTIGKIALAAIRGHGGGKHSSNKRVNCLLGDAVNVPFHIRVHSLEFTVSNANPLQKVFITNGKIYDRNEMSKAVPD